MSEKESEKRVKKYCNHEEWYKGNCTECGAIEEVFNHWKDKGINYLGFGNIICLKCSGELLLKGQSGTPNAEFYCPKCNKL